MMSETWPLITTRINNGGGGGDRKKTAELSDIPLGKPTDLLQRFFLPASVRAPNSLVISVLKCLSNCDVQVIVGLIGSEFYRVVSGVDIDESSVFLIDDRKRRDAILAEQIQRLDERSLRRHTQNVLVSSDACLRKRGRGWDLN